MLILFLLSITVWGLLQAIPLTHGAIEQGAVLDIALAIALSEWVILTVVMGYVAFLLNEAGIRAATPKQAQRRWMPVASTVAFSGIMALARFGAWVPIEISAVLASPCIFLPPLSYLASTFHRNKEEPPLFNLEERCRSLDSAQSSLLIKQFLRRYPYPKVYLYRNSYSHSAGGLLLHSRERLKVPLTTHLEVTLNCPFTSKVGVMAEGREIFRAYLHRPYPSGSVILDLPQNNWDDWLIGLPQKDWFSRIQELDDKEKSLPNINGLPCQFHESNWTWQVIELT
jgi:hypothetical protein